MPKRTRKIAGEFYELAGIAPSYQLGQAELVAVAQARFAGLDWFAYGNFRDEMNAPAVVQHATDSQKKWPEVMAVEGDAYLIWARPAGTRYIIKAGSYDRKPVYNAEIENEKEAA